MPTDGGEAKRLTSVEDGAQKPLWAPDGKHILFLSNVFKGEKAKDSDVKIIQHLKYKYNGRGFFEGKWTHLFFIPLNGGETRDLTDDEYNIEAFDLSHARALLFLMS
jgi:Tol biopolymer transport system component